MKQVVWQHVRRAITSIGFFLSVLILPRFRKFRAFLPATFVSMLCTRILLDVLVDM